MIPGVLPFESHGRVIIELSEASGEALNKVQDIESWSVGPTMKRGAGKGNAFAQDPAPKSRRRIRKKTIVKKSALKNNKAKAKAQAKNRPEVSLEPPEAHDFRRGAKGHEHIREELRMLMDLASEKFPQSPIFDSNGNCRMKGAVAKKITRSQILEQGPLCIEALYFDCTPVFLESFRCFWMLLVYSQSNFDWFWNGFDCFLMFFCTKKQ